MKSMKFFMFLMFFMVRGSWTVRDINYITTKMPGHTLRDFEQLLLISLAHLGEDAHGGSIRRLIETRTGRLVSPGAIYTACDRLERRGYLTSSLGEPTPERGGKRKRYYRLRPPGLTALRAQQAAQAGMLRGLKTKLEP
jgi:DNA-binding PadR family transcriptional regulator